MAVTTTHEQAALRVADWRAQAALEGKTFAEVATAAMKARFTGRKLLTAAEAWGNLSDRTREVLVIMCTDRPSANRVRWDMLTEAEKLAIGAMARTTLKELNASARTLRA
ncbi:MAG TPA: hypothetical protein H9903_10500 [Candidatus Aquabacterium excrementipullorum]|nr:hypothetical protein [Candidatus Aquabacterium excrementipullorum]